MHSFPALKQLLALLGKPLKAFYSFPCQAVHYTVTWQGKIRCYPAGHGGTACKAWGGGGGQDNEEGTEATWDKEESQEEHYKGRGLWEKNLGSDLGLRGGGHREVETDRE